MNYYMEKVLKHQSILLELMLGYFENLKKYFYFKPLQIFYIFKVANR